MELVLQYTVHVYMKNVDQVTVWICRGSTSHFDMTIVATLECVHMYLWLITEHSILYELQTKCNNYISNPL